VVVYKVDRLTRSLADFAKLVELFDEHEVSFVSVTQSFNTTSSMGRLTLNVLLSFAQFEREVIGERVRDKIAASKRRGIWVGGPVPLGYRAVDKKLEIVAQEADLVRRIFALYIELGSVGALARALDSQGVKPKPRQLANGNKVAAERYTTGPLAHMLKNRFYVGEVAYRGEVHKGEHPAIVDREVFDRVQAMLSERTVARTLKRGNSPHLLTGLIFDDRGNPMSPTHANKKGVRYRYYTSHALLQRRKEHAGSVPRVPAPEVEELVCKALRRETSAAEMSDRDLIASNDFNVFIRTGTDRSYGPHAQSSAIRDSTGVSPAELIERNMPLLDQFLKSNMAAFQVKIFGVSAQGLSLKDQAAVERASKRNASERILIVEEKERGHDITKPLVWRSSALLANSPWHATRHALCRVLATKH
jgi:hypothetical protein